jgi:tRNA dimethylallyltransferase
MSHHHLNHAFQDSRYEYLQIVLQLDRALLYNRIEKRCDQMVADGFIEEVKSLLARGYHSGLRSMQSLGYRHCCSYLEGQLTLKEALRTMKRDTRHYAKRQLTWFRADPRVIWVNDPLKNFHQFESIIKNFLFS